jgi:hypothetical protein
MFNKNKLASLSSALMLSAPTAMALEALSIPKIADASPIKTTTGQEAQVMCKKLRGKFAIQNMSKGTMLCGELKKGQTIGSIDGKSALFFADGRICKKFELFDGATLHGEGVSVQYDPNNPRLVEVCPTSARDSITIELNGLRINMNEQKKIGRVGIREGRVPRDD